MVQAKLSLDGSALGLITPTRSADLRVGRLEPRGLRAWRLLGRIALGWDEPADWKTFGSDSL